MSELNKKHGLSWDVNQHEDVVTPGPLVEFLAKLETLCQESGISISHEDGQGSFVFEAYNQPTMDWLKAGNIDFPRSKNHH